MLYKINSINASLVQLVERRSPKPNVEGSSPSGRGAIIVLWLEEFQKLVYTKTIYLFFIP